MVVQSECHSGAAKFSFGFIWVKIGDGNRANKNKLLVICSLSEDVM